MPNHPIDDRLFTLTSSLDSHPTWSKPPKNSAGFKRGRSFDFLAEQKFQRLNTLSDQTAVCNNNTEENQRLYLVPSQQQQR